MIFHIAPRDEWERGAYVPASLATEGFVHLSTAEQLDETLSLYFAGREVAVLAIDEASLGDRLRWEPPAGPHARSGQVFPHWYGAFDAAAVVGVTMRSVGSPGTGSGTLSR